MCVIGIPDMKTLPQFIADIGDAQAAALFDVKERTAMAWRLRERYPRPEKANEIVEKTEGEVSFEGIYGIAHGEPGTA